VKVTPDLRYNWIMKTVHVVFGYRNSGSGSLTFPEDFEFEGFYENKKDAQDHCDRLNRETLAGMEDEEGNPIEDIYDLECGDETIYETHALDNLKK
jgi:hypothetical protein